MLRIRIAKETSCFWQMQQQPSTMNIPTPRIHSLSLQFPLRTKIFIFKAEACLSVEFPLFSSIFQLFHMYSIFSCIFWVGLYMLMMVKTTTVCSTTEGHTPQTRYLAQCSRASFLFLACEWVMTYHFGIPRPYRFWKYSGKIPELASPDENPVFIRENSGFSPDPDF